jgi:hypothetical protein
LKKIVIPPNQEEKICDDYSTTTKKLAKDNGFGDIEKFFRWHKEWYGDE